MKITEIAFSTYPVTDMNRARTFYEGVLGLKATMEHRSATWPSSPIQKATLSAFTNANLGIIET